MTSSHSYRSALSQLMSYADIWLLLTFMHLFHDGLCNTQVPAAALLYGNAAPQPVSFRHPVQMTSPCPCRSWWGGSVSSLVAYSLMSSIYRRWLMVTQLQTAGLGLKVYAEQQWGQCITLFLMNVTVMCSPCKVCRVPDGGFFNDGDSPWSAAIISVHLALPSVAVTVTAFFNQTYSWSSGFTKEQ